MAFAGRISGLLKQGLSQKSGSSFVPISPIVTRAYNGPKYRLFVGGLGQGIDEQTLAEAFSLFGDLIEAKVIMDIDTGVSRGFGFVSFGDEDDATAAMRMDGQELAGRLIRVNSADSIGTAARKKAPRGRT
ncbi:unnamed protein product [Rhodiola kirilowii]